MHFTSELDGTYNVKFKGNEILTLVRMVAKNEESRMEEAQKNISTTIAAETEIEVPPLPEGIVY